MASRSLSDLEIKRCTKCGTEKPVSEFPVKRKKPAARCKTCTAEYSSEWAKKNRDHLRDKERARREANPELFRERQRAWVAKNRERANAYTKTYRERHPDKAKAAVNSWIERNKEAKLACYRNWAARNKSKVLRRNGERKNAQIKAIPSWYGEFDAFVFDEALALSGMRSALTGIEHNIDHVVPLRSKVVCGLHCASNFAVIPALENKSKGNRYWPDMEIGNGI